MQAKSSFFKRVKIFFKSIAMIFLFPLFVYAEGNYAPVMVDDILIFVPYSKVKISLGADRTLSQNEHQILRPNIENKEDIVSYSWVENGRVIGSDETFSTAILGVGTHTLTLEITDIHGVTTNDEITITIEEYVLGDAFVGTTKGEFMVNQGSAVYNLKIAVPPGVAGMEPQLSLRYNSQSDNGYMGMGWSIDGISSITRCSQTEAVDGASHKFGVRYNTNDRFCLDGQRLINIKGTYGAANTEYRTEINNYSKIVSRSNSAGGPNYFDVYSKSGLHYIYGANSSTYEKRSGTPKISWKVDRIIDTYGNTIYFTYKKDESIGTHYLWKITYAGTDANDVKSNSIEYVYEDRADLLSGYTNGHPFATKKRLKEIVVKAGSTKVRSYNIGYENEDTGSQRSFVSDITESVEEGVLKTLSFTHTSEGSSTFKKGVEWSSSFGSSTWKADTYQRNIADINGDGLADILGFGYDKVQVSLSTGSGFGSVETWGTGMTYKNGWRAGKHIRSVIDMNADGLPDIVGFADIGVHVALNTGSGFAAVKKWSNDFGSNVWDNSKYIRTLADMNGDGYPDIVGFGYDKLYVSLNNKGQGFKAATVWSDKFTYARQWKVGKHLRWVTDVNGDGLPDIIGFADIGVYVSLNTGKGLEEPVKWNNNFGSNVWTNSRYIRTLSDINGDGLPDIVGFGESAVYVALNKGYGFATWEIWSDEFAANAWRLDRHVRMLSDVNGDGLDDIVGFGDSAVYVALSTGSGFEKSKKWVDGFSYCLCWRVADNDRVLPDVNGDGLPDIVGFANNGVYVGENERKISLLSHISNEADQDIRINYGDMINNDTLYYNYSQHNKRNKYAWNTIANDNIELSLPMSLVASVSRLDGVGGYNTLKYRYYGYIANKLRGIQGFHAIDTFNLTQNSNAGIRYKQIEASKGKGFEYTGMPYLTYQGDTLTYVADNLFSKTDITYKSISKYSHVYEPYTYSNVETIYDPKSKEHIQSIYRTNTMSNDGLGNITKKVTRVYDVLNSKNFTKTIENTYDKENITKWYIGRLTKATVTHTQTDGGQVVRASTFKYNSEGLLSQEVANVGTGVALTKDYVYDGHGNKKTETISGKHITTATTTFNYSSDGKFQTSVTDDAGLSIKRSYDKRFGRVTSIIGPDGLKTTWTYDGLGRKYRERRADGTTTLWLHKWYGSAVMNSAYLHYVQTVRSGVPDTYVLYDSLARERSAYTTTLGGKKLYTQLRTFNKKGEVIKEALPYIEGEGSIQYVTSTYDDYGRVISQSKPSPDGSTQTSTHSYQGFTVVTTDPNGIQKQVVKNAIGQVLHTSDAFGETVASSIDYSYDAIGNLLSTTDSQSNTISMQYDAAGNKTYMNDPDLGVWQYRYRADGKLYLQWSGAGNADASHHVTEIDYDILGRMTSKTIYDKEALGSQGANAYTYNYTDFEYNAQNGRVSKENFESRQDNGAIQGGYILPAYDSLGRVVSTDKYINGKGSFVSRVSYDAYSRPSHVTYPNGYSVTNHYSYGILDQVTGSDGKVHYKINKLTSFGQIADATYGNGVRTVKGYNDAGALESIRSGANGHYYSADVQNLQYTYDKLGNVLSRDDYSITGKEIKESFGYDAMNRLTSVTMQTDVAHTGRESIVYAYDSIGNMIEQSGLGHYTYYADKPHAVKSVGSKTYIYDAVGNVVNRDGDTIAYNAMNMPTTLVGKNGSTVHFYYNTQGNRFKKEVAGVNTYYLGKSYEEEVQSNGTDKKQTCYISVGGKTVGQHVEVVDETYSLNPSNPNYKSTYNRYFHTDALGSITAITDDTGAVVERRSYEAFGKIRAMDYGLTGSNAIIPTNTVTETTRAYTGHEQIKEIDGLIHMNARIYDSDIGRFLSADTIIQDPLDSQAYNRYSYVRNNPMVFTDPSGHSWLSKLWKKAKKWVKKKWKKFIGAVLIVGGVAVAAFVPGGQTIGAAIAGAGVSLYNYDKTGKFEFQAPIIETGEGGNSEAEQATDLQEQSDAIDRAQSGTIPTSASPVTNDNFANGAGTDAYSHTGGNDSYSENSDGEITLAPITITALPQGYDWIEDLPSYTYEAFTYTNVGGVIDVGYQYYSGEIGGYYAAGLLGATALGGKAGGKAFSSFGEARRLYKEWGVGSFDTVSDNIRYHTQYRGNGNYAKYMRQASNFNKRGSKKTYLDDGAIRYNRPNGEFLIQRDGLTVTYGVNR